LVALKARVDERVVPEVVVEKPESQGEDELGILLSDDKQLVQRPTVLEYKERFLDSERGLENIWRYMQSDTIFTYKPTCLKVRSRQQRQHYF
jgi:hypothetical protein